MFFLNFILIFYVKDRKSGRCLLQGSSKDGLYQFVINKNMTTRNNGAIVMLGERVFEEQWHNRLGHPTMRIVGQIIASNNLPFDRKKLPYI